MVRYNAEQWNRSTKSGYHVAISYRVCKPVQKHTQTFNAIDTKPIVRSLSSGLLLIRIYAL